MKFPELLAIVQDHPVFSSAVLRAGDVDPVDIASQLSRWVAAGKLISLRRGVYALAKPYRRREPHPFEIANLLVRSSYVSLEAALSYYGLIPEAVFVTTSVTQARPSQFETQLGRFEYRAIGADYFWGYTSVVLSERPTVSALVARPEKALLDLVYLRTAGDSEAFLRELRLDRLDTLDQALLREYADRFGKPKLSRAVGRIEALAAENAEGWVAL